MSRIKIRFSDGDFQKSSLSKHSKKLCVEVAIKPEAVGVRDSKDQRKTVLKFTRAEWKAFVAGVKAGEFDV
ncbi:MAG: DUF397 domain-containing protein [Candidatus Paceibacterota bacterium]